MSDILNKWIGTGQVDSRTIKSSDSYTVAGLQINGDLGVTGRSIFSSDSTFFGGVSTDTIRSLNTTSHVMFLSPVHMLSDSTASSKFLVQGTLTGQDATFQSVRSLSNIVLTSNLGVGTTTPGDRVVILGAMSDSTTRLVLASLNPAGVSTFNIGLGPDVWLAHYDATILHDPSHRSELMNTDNVPLIIGTGGIERIRFTENNPPVNYGYIGIGTTQATSQVDIYGPSPTNNNSGQVELHGSETSGAADMGSGVLFKGHDGSNERSWGAIQFLKENSLGGNWDSYARISVRANSPIGYSPGVIERVRVTSKGYIGIGTINPSTWLHVHGPTSGSSMAFTDSTTGALSGLRVGIDTAEAAYVTNIGGTSLYFGTNNIEQMRIDSAGNVGIGTTNPGSKLEIFSTSNQLKLSDGTDNYSTFGVDTSGNMSIALSGQAVGIGVPSVSLGNARLSLGSNAYTPEHGYPFLSCHVMENFDTTSVSVHGITDIAPTDVVGLMELYYSGSSAASGGLKIVGLNRYDQALRLWGLAGTMSYGDPVTEIMSAKHDGGTGWTDLAATDIALQVSNNYTKLMSINGAGDMTVTGSVSTGRVEIGTVQILTGVGVPAVTAPNGSIFLRTDGAGPNLYVRENGSWVSK